MKTKAFDCIKMKEECQRACQKAYGRLPLEERRKKMIATILANPVLGDFYRQTFRPVGLEATGNFVGQIAETEGVYSVKNAMATKASRRMRRKSR